jgi:serine/threonine protein kinase
VHVTDDVLAYHPHKDDPESALLLTDAFGKTFRMVSKERIFSVRRINIKKAEKAGTPLTDLKRRVLQLLSTDHPSIPNYRCCFFSGDKTLCLVTDHFEGTSVWDVLEGTPGGFERDKCEAVLSTIARGLEGLHSRGFGHWNLTLDNVMLVDSTASKLKLINFGMLVHSDRGNLPVGSSPQRAEGLPLTPEDDLWAMGCMLFELMSGVPTAKRHTVGGGHTSAALTPAEVLAAAEACGLGSSQRAARWLKLLSTDPAERPTVPDTTHPETLHAEPETLNTQREAPKQVLEIAAWEILVPEFVWCLVNPKP